MPIRALTQDDLRYLVCPVCHAQLTLETNQPAIRCSGCARLYPIVDGLPVLLAARASACHVHDLKERTANSEDID